MSWDIEICKNGVPIEFPNTVNISGGTYALGGTSVARLNVTYNYSCFFRAHLHPDSLKALDGMTVETAMEHVDCALVRMTGEPDDNYWKTTEGNAKKALIDLKMLMQLCPKSAVLEVH